MKPKVISMLITVGALATLSACGPASLQFRANADNQSGGGGNTIQGTPVVCQPLGGGTTTSGGGLVGQMYYLDPGATPLNSVNDYISSGHLDPSTFYFNQLNVPTEQFMSGFKDGSGNYLKSPAGAILYENFALVMKSVVSLSASDAPGYYQFGVLSDDGAIIEALDSKGNYSALVNNDGQHPTRMGCGTSIVQLNSSTKLNVRIKYYQGPRDYISLIPMWRKVDPSVALDTTYCGDTGNTTFFNSATTPSTPQPEYNGLLAHHWAPLKASNYTLPAGVTNPCPI